MKTIVKAVFDLVASTILLFVLAPVMICIGILIYCNLGSPVIFKQQRPGLYGIPFYMYKFRTMTEERDKQGCLLPDEKRLTMLGAVIRKLSLDELPQLVNVLKGELSLVGPRPLLMNYLLLYTPEQARRHDVKPGITGWAQVNGRTAISWDEKFNLDIWYVDNQSFWLDIKILFLTAVKVFYCKDINLNSEWQGNKEH